MMQRIKALSLDTINKIAAGEVVERPASVIKELIENSLDAQSSKIEVILSDAGKKLISIKDDGTGIHPDDMELALQRHATSKITNSDDLFEIHTLGFRGEALSAVASVSRLNVTSKNKNCDYGLSVICEFGNIKGKEKKAVAQGTSINVEDLYFNTPARLKFLKASATELSHCITVINNYAVSYPAVAFSLTHNGKIVFNYNSSKSFEERINNVYGKTIQWLNAKSSYEYVSGEVYIADPSQPSEKNEFKIYINGRAIKDRMCSHALSSSFEKHLSTGLPPITILFLNIEPAFIDVNVSPTKNEVRFRESNLIHGFIQSLVSQALNIKQDNAGTQSFTHTNFNPSFTRPFNQPTKNINLFENINNVNNERDFVEVNKTTEDGTKIIGQFKKQYLLIEQEDKLVMLDQHAAHERVNFEKIFKALSQPKDIQHLLIPELLEFSPESADKFRKKIQELNTLGFDIEEFSGEESPNPAFIVRSIPKILEGISIIEALHSISSDYEDVKETMTTKLAKISARLSCHDSIRGARQLSPLEAKTLLEDLQKCDYPHVCPHGRPVKIEFSFSEIEKMFKRK